MGHLPVPSLVKQYKKSTKQTVAPVTFSYVSRRWVYSMRYIFILLHRQTLHTEEAIIGSKWYSWADELVSHVAGKLSIIRYFRSKDTVTQSPGFPSIELQIQQYVSTDFDHRIYSIFCKGSLPKTYLINQAKEGERIKNKQNFYVGLYVKQHRK